MDSRARQRGSLPLLVPHRMLDNSSSKPTLWPSRVHLHLLLCFFCRDLLDVCRAYLVELVPWSLLAWSGCRRKVHHHSGLRCRVCTSFHSRCSCHAVADVDGFRNYAWWVSRKVYTLSVLMVPGYIASVAFMDVPSPANLPGLNWRLMFGVTAIP